MLPIETGGIKILYNVLNVIPQSMVPFLIMGDRILQSFIYGVAATYLMSFDSEWTTGARRENLKDNRQRYSIFQAFFRLSYSMYLVNYFVVKTEYFTSRTVFPTSVYSMVTRATASTISMMIASVFFHLIFVSPFDNLRRSWVSKMMTRSRNDNNTQKKSREIDENANAVNSPNGSRKSR